MAFVTFAPNWFFGYDIVLELVFAVIALILAIFALRIYKITSERSTRLLGSGFLLISVSYFFQSFFNFFLISEVGAKPFLTLNEFSLAITLQLIGAYGQIFFMLIGLIVLLYMTFEVKNGQILAIMILLGLIPLLFAENPLFVFYLLSTICFAFVAWHFIRNYFRKRKQLSMMIAISFILLVLSGLDFLLSTNQNLFYILGHALELLAYVIILLNFYMVLKK